MKQKIIIAGAVVLIAIIAIVLLNRSQTTDTDTLKNQEVSMEEPLDIAVDFYTAWLAARKAEDSSPYTQNLHAFPILSESLRTQIAQAENRAEDEIDPVLCQTTLPEKVGGRVVSQTETLVRILMTAREKELTAQSVFNIKRHNDGWYIDTIECAPGEFAPEREFSVERIGYLIKNVPPPLDSNNWHIVFEDDGVLGSFAPLFFNGESLCKTGADGAESTCVPDQFTETAKVFVHGQMLESGVDVKRLEMVQ